MLVVLEDVAGLVVVEEVVWLLVVLGEELVDDPAVVEPALEPLTVVKPTNTLVVTG